MLLDGLNKCIVIIYKGQLEACVSFNHSLGWADCIIFCFNGICLQASVSFNHSHGWGLSCDDWGIGFGVCALSYFKKEDEVIILEKDIYEDLGTNKIVIDVDGTDAILSVSAEEYLRVLSTKRQKSSLLYT